jgi:hypothetical protein
MSTHYEFVGDAASLLAAGPRAVDSFSAGHWQLMLTLEARAPEVIGRNDVDLAASFLADVVFLNVHIRRIVPSLNRRSLRIRPS